ncbi:MAG: hypothetical protein WAP49_09340, partial [Mycobacterium sp.]
MDRDSGHVHADSRGDEVQGDPADAPVTDGPPRALLIAAVLVPVVAIGVVLAMAASLSTPPAPVAIAA